MLEYIYFVKCPGCEDEHFNFFNEAKEYAISLLSKKPIITQIEVDRNDFGECVDSCDLGTVWSWEEMMKDEHHKPEIVFTKADTFKDSYDYDPEFAALDNSLDDFSEGFEVGKKVFCKANKKIGIIKNTKGDLVDVEFTGGKDPDRVDTYYKQDLELAEVHKPVPDGMSIKDLVEEMEENEDTVECAGCEELFAKDDCFHKDGIGWLCSDCEDRVVKCSWCDELYDRSECRKEVDMGWLCDRCQAAIMSRGEELTFKENSYWDFLDEDVQDNMTLADLVKDSINHLVNDLGKDSTAEDFTDDVIGDLERNYDGVAPDDINKYQEWCSEVACEVSRQLNRQEGLTEAFDRNAKVEFEYDSLEVTLQSAKRAEDDWDEAEDTVNYSFYKKKDDVATDIWENFIQEVDAKNVEGGLEALEDDRTWYDFLETNFDTLLDKYYDKLLKYYEDDARKEYEEGHSLGECRQKSFLEEFDDAEAHTASLTDCPECGAASYDMKEQYCSNCGFGL